MRTFLLAIFFAITTTTSAFATTNQQFSDLFIDSTDATIVDYYKTVVKQIPYTEETCRTVDVPIYGNVGKEPTTGDILTGAIIGGVIGNNIKGEKNGGAAGAVIGGLIGANKGKQQGIVGYKQEEQCSTTTKYTRSSEEVYDYSIVQFTAEGHDYKVRFQKR